MPGMGEVIEGAVQHAPQSGRQSIDSDAIAAMNRGDARPRHSGPQYKYDSFLSEQPMAKSATFGVMHLGIAFGVSFALTGSVVIAGAITLVEPLVNTVAHYHFDRWWARREQRRTAAVSRRQPPQSLVVQAG